MHPELTTRLQVNVGQGDLVAAPSHPDEWLTHARTFDGWRYSPLAEITTAQRRQPQAALGPPARDQRSDRRGHAAGRRRRDVHVGAAGGVVALDIGTGDPIWHYGRDHAARHVAVLRPCQPRRRAARQHGVHRHARLLPGRARRRTGTPRWEIKVADVADGYSITVAPLAVADLVIVGVSGGEFGVRGFLAAYAADTGKQVWRFNTVPGPGEPGHETWQGESWKTGGAPTWVTGAYDPSSISSTGASAIRSPIYSGVDRAGDNLYSNSVDRAVAPHRQRVWHFQFTPHDEHDWDSNQTPILAELGIGGSAAQGVLGQPQRLLLRARPHDRRVPGRQASSSSRPGPRARRARPADRRAGRPPDPQGCAGVPRRRRRHQLAVARVPPRPRHDLHPGDRRQLDVHQLTAREAHAGRAVRRQRRDRPRNSSRWSRRSTPRPATSAGSTARRARTGIASRSGLLTTAGDLVFGACEGQLFALDARTGAEVWRVGLGGITSAAPISFALDGHQAIAIAAGRSVFVFGP